MIFHSYDGLDGDYQELKQQYELAGKAIKEHEYSCRDISIPAINELRNALYHLIDGLQSSEAAQQEQIKKATAHCKRARFDAKDGILIYLLDIVANIRNRLDGEIYRLPGFISDYGKLKAGVIAAQEFLKTLPADTRNRDEYYEKCDQHIRALQTYCEAYFAVEEEVQAAICNGKIKFWVSVGIGVIGIIATLLICFL